MHLCLCAGLVGLVCLVEMLVGWPVGGPTSVSKPSPENDFTNQVAAFTHVVSFYAAFRCKCVLKQSRSIAANTHESLLGLLRPMSIAPRLKPEGGGK